MDAPPLCRVCFHRWPDSHMETRVWASDGEVLRRRCNDCVECLPRDRSGATARETVPAILHEREEA